MFKGFFNLKYEVEKEGMYGKLLLKNFFNFVSLRGVRDSFILILRRYKVKNVEELKSNEDELSEFDLLLEELVYLSEVLNK